MKILWARIVFILGLACLLAPLVFFHHAPPDPTPEQRRATARLEGARDGFFTAGYVLCVTGGLMIVLLGTREMLRRRRERQRAERGESGR